MRLSVPDGAQMSEDGNYWWDGSEWQLVTPQQDPESPDDGSADLQLDWSEYPEMCLIAQYAQDVDGYLQAIEIDPAIFGEDSSESA